MLRLAIEAVNGCWPLILQLSLMQQEEEEEKKKIIIIVIYK